MKCDLKINRICMYVCMYGWMDGWMDGYMTISMYCLCVGFNYTYIDINALAQGIKHVLASHVYFKPLLGLEPMTPIRPQIPASHVCMYLVTSITNSVFSNVTLYHMVTRCIVTIIRIKRGGLLVQIPYIFRSFYSLKNYYTTDICHFLVSGVDVKIAIDMNVNLTIAT